MPNPSGVKIVKLDRDQPTTGETLRVKLAPEELSVSLRNKTSVPVTKITERLKTAFEEGCSTLRRKIQLEESLEDNRCSSGNETSRITSRSSIPPLNKPKWPRGDLVQSLLNIAWDCFEAKYSAIITVFQTGLQNKVDNTRKLLLYRKDLETSSHHVKSRLTHLGNSAMRAAFEKQWHDELQWIEEKLGTDARDEPLENLSVLLDQLQDQLFAEEALPNSAVYTEVFLSVLVDGHAKRGHALQTLFRLQAQRQTALLKGQLEQLSVIDANIRKCNEDIDTDAYLKSPPKPVKPVEPKEDASPMLDANGKKRVRWDPSVFEDVEEDLEDSTREGDQLAMLAVMKLDLDVRLASVREWGTAWSERARLKRRKLLATAGTFLLEQEQAFVHGSTADLAQKLKILDHRQTLAETELSRYAEQMDIKHDVQTALRNMRFAYEIGLETARDALYSNALADLRAVT